MPFSPITVNTKTFVQSGTNRYMLNSVSFGQPLNYFKVSGGTSRAKEGGVTASVTRVIEKDVVVAGSTVRKSCTVQLVIQTSPEFSSGDVDVMASDISEFLTIATLDRVLNGES